LMNVTVQARMGIDVNVGELEQFSRIICMETEEENQIRLGLACVSNEYRMKIFKIVKNYGILRYSDFPDYNSKNKLKLYNNVYYLMKRNILKSTYDENGEMFVELNEDFVRKMADFLN